MIDDERVQLFRLHPCSLGLDEAALQEVAAAAEIIRCEAGDVIVDSQTPVTSIYLVIHGRVRLQLLDIQGRVAVQRFQSRGGQVGGMAAALGEPQPFRCAAEDPSVLLRFDYATALSFSRRHEAFRANYARLMAESVKQALLYEKTPSPPQIVAFLHRSEATREVSRRALGRLVALGETPHAFVDRSLGIDGLDERRFVDNHGATTPEEFRRHAATLLQSGRIVFDVQMDADASLTVRAAEACEQIYWCVTPDTWESSIELLKRMVGRAATLRDKVRLVWLLDAGELAPVAHELRSLTRGDVKVCLAMPDPNWGPVAFDGVERLVHLLRGVQIGVALGGGAARGMAHLGVLPALARSGITVDRIAGTSAGAMTGTLYAAGLPAENLTKSFVADLQPSFLFRLMPRGEQWDLLYKYRRGKFDPMLRKYLGDARMEQLHVPTHTITVDLISGSEVVRSGGDAVHGIVESINLPLLSTPIRRDGEALVDGGLINNVPANVLTAKGCNFVIAISVTAKMERRFAQNEANTPASLMRPASTIQTLLRSYLVQSHSVNALGVQPADFVIEPDVTQFELSAFTQADKIAAVGEQATLAAIDSIRAMLHRLDPQLFPLP
jgi:NTE family protein